MLTAFLPCRKGSQRIPDKNVKPFAGVEGGLLAIKLRQLLECEAIDRVLVSSNDRRVLDFAAALDSPEIEIDERPDHLGTSDTLTDELIAYVPSLIEEGDVLWTHVTSPFLDGADYARFITLYREHLTKGHDSLMTVNELRGFVWNRQGALNYDRSQEKWPRTQLLEPLYEVDSGAFIAPISIYRKLGDRIGHKPFLCVQEEGKGIDIDWPEDFRHAERLWLETRSR